MAARRVQALGQATLPLVPALAISLYWLLSGLQGESPSIAAIYRHGDYTYFPALAGLAQLSVGEWLVAEQLGDGVRSFPFPGLLLHGLAFGALGPLGLVAADALLAIGAYLAARRLLRTCGIGVLTSELLALVVSCGLLNLAGAWISSWTDWTLRLQLWGFRLPRPLVTDVLLLLCVDRALGLFVRRRDAWREWAWLGVWFGLLLQCNFYAGASVGLGIAFGLADRTRRGWTAPRAARSLASLGVSAATVALPFALQRLLEHPDVPVRLGSFPVPRLDPLPVGPALARDIAAEVGQALTAAALAAGAIAWRGAAERAVHWASLGAVSLLSALSALALPASTLLLGRTVQPYHFLEELVTFKTLALLVSAACLIEVSIGAVADRGTAARRTRLRAALLVAVALAGWAGAVKLHRPWIQRADHVRSDFASYRIPGYRGGFRELTEALGRQRQAGAQVLATLDIQVHAWWALFGAGRIFAPDPFASAVSDAEIEERLLRLLRTLGATPDDVARLLDDRAVQIFFLSCNKYQLSRGYHPAPLLDYPAQALRDYRRTTAFSSWVIAMPLSERRRLLERYNRTPPVGEDRRLDLIVLGRGPLDRGLAPPADRFGLVFDNAWFRVYAASAPGAN